jgi:hypothetical protein
MYVSNSAARTARTTPLTRQRIEAVAKIVRTKVLSLKPDHVLTGHGPRPKGTAFLEDLLKRTESALADSSGK